MRINTCTVLHKGAFWRAERQMKGYRRIDSVKSSTESGGMFILFVMLGTFLI
jgi:hypothetical protein